MDGMYIQKTLLRYTRNRQRVLKGFRCIFLLILFTGSGQLFAQPWKEFHFDHYTVEDGLPSDEVNLMVQDKLGYIWAGTSVGLCKFDGNRWTSYAAMPKVSKSYTNTSVISIFHDQKQRIWFGTKSTGVNRIDRLTQEFHNFNFSAQDTTTIAGTVVSGVFEDNQGRIWVCANGLNLFDEETASFQRIPLRLPASLSSKTRGWANTLRYIQADPKEANVVWLYSSFGLLKFNTTNFNHTYFFPHEQEHATRMAIMEGQTIWMTNYGVGLYAFDIQSKTFALFYCDSNPENLLGCQSSASLLALDDRYLLLSGYSENLYIFDRLRNEFIFKDATWPQMTYQYPEGIFMKDREDRIWIATYGDGIYIQQKQFGQFEKHRIPGDFQDILQRGNQIYGCNSEGQLVIVDESVNKPIRTLSIRHESGQAAKPIKLHIDAGQQLWILSRNALHALAYDQKSVRAHYGTYFEQEGQDYNYFWDITSDSISGRIWLATQSSGLFGYSPQMKDLYTFSKQKNSTNHISNDYSIGSLVRDRNNCIWGFNSNGYFKVDPATEGVANSPVPIISSLDKKPLVGNHLACLDDKGTLWITSGHGRLAKITETENLRQELQELAFDLEILEDPANDILADHRGNIWVSSSHGLFRYNIASRKVDHFGRQVGLSEINGLDLNSFGEILAATEGGYYRFNPDQIIPFNAVPQPMIESFRVFDTPYFIPEDISQGITLTYKQNFFSFEFSAIDFTGKSKKEFAYILEGINEDWIIAGDRRYAAYTNIPGGTYAFKVKARNDFGAWSRPVALEITIIPPYWKRTWFWVLSMGILITIVYFMYASRIEAIKKEEQLKTAFSQQLAEVEMKALRAQMNPHFLFNSLNAIKYYVLKRSKEKAAEYLTDFARLIRLVLNNSAHSLITLDKELEALELYIRIERLRFDEKFNYRIDIDPTLNTAAISIPPLLIQPFVENAIWHGLMHKTEHTGYLIIKVSRVANGIECIIEDNGIGRKRAAEVKSKSAQQQKSFGLNITQDRMAMSKILNDLDITTEIHDLYDQDGQASGTRIVLQMVSKGPIETPYTPN